MLATATIARLGMNVANFIYIPVSFENFRARGMFHLFTHDGGVGAVSGEQST